MIGEMHMSKRKITVLGGDQRNLSLANLLLKDDNDVNIFGFDKMTHDIELEEEKELPMAIRDSDILIGPLPFTDDNKSLNMPFSSQKIKVDDLIKNMTKDQILIGGRIDVEFKNLARDYGIQIVDYFEREEMQVLNAIPTAEGAIQIAMEEMPITLHNSNAMVLGFGRIGKVLSKMLYGIGANVYVEARNYTDISWINVYGYKPVFLKDLGDYLPKMDVIFNTIPTIVLEEEMLNRINPESLIVDLASKPGGIDFDKAREMEINTVWALALPGKVAPITAAKCIKETIYNIIEELEV